MIRYHKLRWFLKCPCPNERLGLSKNKVRQNISFHSRLQAREMCRCWSITENKYFSCDFMEDVIKSVHPADTHYPSISVNRRNSKWLKAKTCIHNPNWFISESVGNQCLLSENQFGIYKKAEKGTRISSASKMSTAETAVSAIIGILGGLGTIMNTTVLIILFKNKLTSKLTTALMRSQCIVDGYASMMALLYQIIGPVIITPWVGVNRILCYAWFEDELFWLGPLLSVQNLVCISFDRLMAVNCPMFYRLHQIALMVGCYIYSVAVCLLLFLPTILLRHFTNETCSFAVPAKNSPLDQVLDLHSIFWLLLAYFLPAVFIIICHVVVICFIRDIRNRERGDDQRSKSHKSLYKLIKITTGLVVSVLICHSLESLRYMLASLHVLNYEPGSAAQQAGVVMITLCCFFNPCLSLHTKVSLRRIFNEKLIPIMSNWRLSTGRWNWNWSSSHGDKWPLRTPHDREQRSHFVE